MREPIARVRSRGSSNASAASAASAVVPRKSIVRHRGMLERSPISRSMVDRKYEACSRSIGDSNCSAGKTAERAGDVGELHVAELQRDQGDAVVPVAEIIGGGHLIRGHNGHRRGLDRDDHNPLVEHLVVLDIGTQRQRRGVFVPVEEDRGAWNAPHRRALLVEFLDELPQRALEALPALGDDLATALPGGHHGEECEADEQRQPGAVDQFGEVRREEQPLDAKERQVITPGLAAVAMER